MTVTYSSGSFSIAEGNRPEQPLATMRVNPTSQRRNLFGTLHDPVVYSYNRYEFIFEKVSLAVVNDFKTMFELVTAFEISDPDELGDLDLVLVLGSVKIEYFTYNTASISFTAEDAEAIA